MKSAARNFIKKAAKCQSIYIAYKSLKCSGCNKMTSQSIKQKNALCLTGEIAGRSNYLKLKCDYVLAGSIAADSKAKETTHKIEIANKSVALAKCLCD